LPLAGARGKPALLEQIKALSTQIDRQLDAHADAYIFTSLPRAGRVRAARVLAEIGDVQVHPVEALDLEGDVLGEDIGDPAGYRHHQLRAGSMTGTCSPFDPRPMPTTSATARHSTRPAGAEPR
jgi:hypothetical protein